MSDEASGRDARDDDRGGNGRRGGERDDRGGDGERGDREGGPRRRGPPLLEWVAAGIGAVIVLGATGFSAFEAMFVPDTPPALEASVTGIRAQPGGHLVSFVVRNTGGATAASVQVRGSLMDGEKEVESSQATFTFVPRGSARRGGLVFEHDPAKYRVVVVPAGFEQP